MLSNRWIINAVLVLVIGALLYLGLAGDDQAEAERASRISQLRPADVDYIDLRYGDSRLELRRDADGWRIQAPVDWPAYDANVERLLSILDSRASPVADATGLELASLGLEPPSASLRFNDTGLLFGANNNIGERRYVMIDSTLYLLPDVHLAFVTQGLPGMADRRLLPKRLSVAALRLPEFEITGDADERWHSPQRPDASHAQLQQLVDNWQGLQASRVKRFDTADNIKQVIEARLADGELVDFLLLSEQPEIVIANPRVGLQYHFREDYRDQLITLPRADDAG